MIKKNDEFPGYLFYDDGSIVNKKGVKMKPYYQKRTGYMKVVLVKADGTKKTVNVHRIIAEMFCEKCPGAEEIDHINGDKTDNRASNLEWVTHNENLRRAVENGQRKAASNVARKVVATDMNTGAKTVYRSIYKAAKALGISKGNICLCCKGKRPFANGYYWEYVK